MASSTLPSIATDNILSGSKKKLHVTALREGAKLHSRLVDTAPGAAPPPPVSQPLTVWVGRAKALSPDEEKPGRKLKSFFHHLLRTKNPKCRFLGKHPLKLR